MSTKSWREAASIMIAARTSFQQIPKSTANYKILMLKRGKTSPFMPGSYVFPGGVAESSDGSKEWLQLYKDNGYTITEENAGGRTQNMNISQYIPEILPLKIAAIRETFEEAGILLCKNKHVHFQSPVSYWASYISSYETETWQNKVKKDPSQFLDLCKHFECVPDIWALHLWSNWLTPTHNTRRFNTTFLLAVLDQMPPAICDKTEMDEMQWSSVSELLSMSNICKIWLPPPQVYELARLYNFNDVETLVNFAHERVKFGCPFWMPVHMKTTDGLLFILPGDDLYPEKPDIFQVGTKLSEVQKTAEEMRTGCDNLHRIEYIENAKTNIVLRNILPSYGHKLPLLLFDRNNL
ncbi:acyl-coenzyme A diphosphatase NUDT19 [Schistocerca serialis cubense]|uniref:acyl-coenzyme A diphosphatase NUDT19 n=1 Tax=Schistocerca serialis cubense TaxID=2023355 RepID=UPI00214E1EE1|nr:acyl-coenzyme A diphosphatase NUDT19 [Schistocerca serialis cubense]XP_049962700.1 acyl-coenzyme A diphosphatase NUDT19 [Schistocerca serialis cubense]XP_049962701.1 acyl-coenzyme A diphosphatase NUDT19 [Schistocerca serialis cubense]XP_049962702.1 acyl-coenzyme A diphosphatase NUDT19 [Schistocerca serialis cubense]XP_049962703.1 acyl-coenzyme A diphosphatase NUDT19 [Schistocerca serialis cubense]XP_049962704.1 acyl-coenzyme A diphosphatase NUDT19 [Schistocerca serialis cubense]XP_04996270